MAAPKKSSQHVSAEDKERRSKELKEFKEVFALFDKNSDGTISTSELGGILRGLNQNFNERQLQQMIKQVDRNGDGQIDFDEFVLMMDSRPNVGGDLDELQEAFKIFDKNGDGHITAEELSSIMHNLGQDIDRETIDLMIKSVDTDGDGTISIKEFRKMMTDGPP